MPTSGNQPPFLMNLFAVPEGSGSEIWVNSPASYLTPLTDPHRSIQIPLPFQTTPKPKVFHAPGKLQFMLDTFDRINDPGSKCGVYAIDYKVSGESEWKYQLQFEEIPNEFCSIRYLNVDCNGQRLVCACYLICRDFIKFYLDFLEIIISSEIQSLCFTEGN